MSHDIRRLKKQSSPLSASRANGDAEIGVSSPSNGSDLPRRVETGGFESSPIRKRPRCTINPNERKQWTLIAKEVGAGALLCFMFLLAAVFLDHRGVVHIKSLHEARKYTFAVLQDPANLIEAENETGLKILNGKVIEEMHRELMKAGKVLKEKKPILDQKVKEIAEGVAAIGTMKKEFDELIKQLPELDKFCGSCKWAGGVTCEGRVDFVVGKGRMTAIRAKMDLIQNKPECVNKG